METKKTLMIPNLQKRKKKKEKKNQNGNKTEDIEADSKNSIGVDLKKEKELVENKIDEIKSHFDNLKFSFQDYFNKEEVENKLVEEDNKKKSPRKS